MFQILAVEDDKNTRMLLKAVLEDENYRAFTAENGEDALSVMDTEHIDLVGTGDNITKPIDEVELLLRIKALLRQAGSSLET